MHVDGELCTVGWFSSRPCRRGMTHTCNSVELPRVVEYTVVPLLKVQELLQHGTEQTRR
jgi:hypothetical protein